MMLHRLVVVLTLSVFVNACQSIHSVTTQTEQTPDSNAEHALAKELAQLPESFEADLIKNYSIKPSAVAFKQENLWWYVKNNLNMTLPNNPRIAKHRQRFQRYPSFVKRVSTRATPYLYHIVQSIEERGLPMELALLPIVESDFDPFAYSHGRASGMWQFISATGKRFGLRINWWYDGRRDVYHSTNAALDYLEYLHKRFDGNWLHAIAAYNSGEGNVIRAIRRNKQKGKPTDFWSLSLPKETEAYVPKLLAMADLLKRHHEFELVWANVPNKPYFEKVTVDSQIDLVVAADLADISLDEFYKLNPGFNHWATEPETQAELLVPKGKGLVFQAALAATPKQQRIAFKRYQIKSGDSLLKIAKKFNTTVDLLKTSNDIRGNTIRAGKSLLIPTAAHRSGEYKHSAGNRLTRQQNKRRKGNKVTIKVKSGDSFWTLSRKHKVGMRELAAWNNMAPTDPLIAGKKLVIWSRNTTAQTPMSQGNKTRKVYYKVRSGDSIARIASRFKVAVNDVVRWNKINPKKYLQPGQGLTLFVDITRQN